jgi:hypothetical protein
VKRSGRKRPTSEAVAPPDPDVDIDPNAPVTDIEDIPESSDGA